MNAIAWKKVLLVEDHELTRVGMQLALEAAWHKVTVAATLQEAIDTISKETFDILLSDTNLEWNETTNWASTGGIELAKEFRKINPNWKIIGMSNKEENKKLWEWVSDDFFEKTYLVRMFTLWKVNVILWN